MIHSQDTSQAFNEEILSEHVVFQTAKRSEMKELLSGYCEGQIKMHKASMRSVLSLLSFRFQVTNSLCVGLGIRLSPILSSRRRDPSTMKAVERPGSIL